MKTKITPHPTINNIKKSLNEYEEYYIIKGNNAYKIIVKKLVYHVEI